MVKNGRLNRNSSYELLRIIAMLMIIGDHYSLHGIQHSLVTDLSPVWLSGSLNNRIFTVLLVPGGQIGVGIFFVLTGYFMINKKIRIEKLLKLSILVLFYSILLFILYIALKALNIYSFKDYTRIVPIKLAIKTFLPISSGAWWFISAYVLLYLFIPIINEYLLKLNKIGLFSVLIFMWLFWYSSSVFGFAYSSLQKGLFFYTLGAYLRLHSSGKSKKRASVILFILMWIGFAVSEYTRSEYLGEETLSKIVRAVLLLLETSVFTPVAVVSLVEYFSRINICSNSIINKISETTFGIYIIHDSSVGRTLIWDGIARNMNQYTSPYYPIYAVITILLVFAICAAIDLFRIKFIEPILWSVSYKKYQIIRSKILC